MPEERTYTVFKFDELSDSAKEKAREWYRGGALDHDWWDATYDDAAHVADILGIDLRTKRVKLMGGGTRYDPCIYFSGFSSQGDGACFEGSYRYAKRAHKKIRKYAPKDATLHGIADTLRALQSTCRYGITATMKQRGHYNHSGCMTVSVDAPEYVSQDKFSGIEENITRAMRDFADWIYSQLEKEYEWQMADEQIDESICANEYTFDESGNRED